MTYDWLIDWLINWLSIDWLNDRLIDLHQPGEISSVLEHFLDSGFSFSYLLGNLLPFSRGTTAPFYDWLSVIVEDTLPVRGRMAPCSYGKQQSMPTFFCSNLFSIVSNMIRIPLVSVLNSGTASDPQAVTCQGRIEDMIFAGADASYSFLITVGADHTCRVIRPELYFFLVEFFFCHWKSLWNLISRCTTVRPLVTGPLGLSSSAGHWLPWLPTSRWPTWPFPMRLAPFSVFPSSLRYPGRSFSVSLLFIWILLWKVNRDFFRCRALQDSRSSHPNLLSESDWNQRYHLSGHSWVHSTSFTASM